MYGERDDPYAVLARLGERLETTLAPAAVLPTLVATIRETLRLPYVVIRLPEGGGAESGTPAATSLTLPLHHQGEGVGELQLAARSPGEAFSAADLRLLTDLARQAGIAVHTLRLTADLQRSRERIITAREEGRRRLRRDLHDGLGPQLASQTLLFDIIGRQMRTDPDRAEALLQTLSVQTQQAINTIRELVYDLRPPALDDLGLAGALRQLADRLLTAAPGLQIHMQFPDPLPPFPAAVEVAIYRITQEALTNVVKHARATECSVTLRTVAQPSQLMNGQPAARVERPGSIVACQLLIGDNGSGISPGRISGVGLQSMHERAAELGGRLVVESSAQGGTQVLAELPVGS
jgi:signal transduction histidine kinase